MITITNDKNDKNFTKELSKRLAKIADKFSAITLSVPDRGDTIHSFDEVDTLSYGVTGVDGTSLNIMFASADMPLSGIESQIRDIVDQAKLNVERQIGAILK